LGHRDTLTAKHRRPHYWYLWPGHFFSKKIRGMSKSVIDNRLICVETINAKEKP
jgi:hypothetical protein